MRLIQALLLQEGFSEAAVLGPRGALCDVPPRALSAQIPDEEVPSVGNRNQRVRLALLAAKATCEELALDLGLTQRQVRHGLWMLGRSGQVVAPMQVATPGERPHKLYELTPRGMWLAKRELLGLKSELFGHDLRVAEPGADEVA